MSRKVVGNVYIINMTIDINIGNWQYSIYVLNFLPVIAGFCRFCRFLPVFSTVPAKILFAMAKPQPWFIAVRRIITRCYSRQRML